MKTFVYSCLTLSLLVGLTSCAPKVYVMDRQTVLEAEATGSFPNLEKSLQDRAMQYGPKMIGRTELEQKDVPAKAYRVLNGDLSHDRSK